MGRGGGCSEYEGGVAKGTGVESVWGGVSCSKWEEVEWGV